MTTVAEERADKARWGFQEGDPMAPGLHAVRHLGGGHRYEAYLAFDERRRYLVVTKILRPDQVHDPSALRGLRREARILEALDHPVIARLFEADLTGDRPHLRLEFVEGPRLSTLLRRFGPLAIDQAVPLAVELGAALHYLHGEGFVHLDVKPSNTIMGAPPRMIDMSVARSVSRATATDHAVGTDAYMAPEQAAPDRGLGPMGPPSDVWGLGITLFEAVTGRLPFPDRDEDPFPQLTLEPGDLPEDVPAPLAEVIRASLSFDAAQRPTPDEICTAVEPLLSRPRRTVLSRLKPR